MSSTPIAIDLINPEDTLPTARQAFPQSGKHPIVAAWIESTVNNWLRREPSCATLVPPGSRDAPVWALRKLEAGQPVHRFLVGSWARDHLAHIEDFLAEAVKAAKNEQNPLHKAATDALRGLPRTGVEQAYRVANEWFKAVARQDDDDVATLKKFKGRKEMEAGGGLVWQMALPSDLRRIASQLENCLGRRHYADDVRAGRSEIWTLQDRDGHILVAAHIDVEGKAIKEAKSKNNTLPTAWNSQIRELAAARKVSTGGQDKLHLDQKEQQILKLRQMRILAEVGGWRVVVGHERNDHDIATGGAGRGEIKAWHEESGQVVEIARGWTKTSYQRHPLDPDLSRHVMFDLTLGSISGVPEVQALETAIGQAGSGFVEILSQGEPADVMNKPTNNMDASQGLADLALMWEDGAAVSWRARVSETRKVGAVSVHALSCGAVVAEYGDRISLLAESKAPLMTVTHGRPEVDHSSWPDMEEVLRTIDPDAARSIAVSPISYYRMDTAITTLPPVRGIDMWPTPDGWKTGDEAWQPLDGHPGFFRARYKLLPEKNTYGSQEWRFNLDMAQAGIVVDELVQQGPDGVRRRVCLMRQGENGVLYIPQFREIEKYEQIFRAIRSFSAGHPIALPKDLSEHHPAVRIGPDNGGRNRIQPIDNSGRQVWSGDDGSTVWKSREAPHNLVGLDANRRVMWASGIPKSGVIAKGFFYDDGVEHLTTFLKGSGNRLGNAWAHDLSRIDHILTNGIPVPLSNPHLDELKTADGGKWVRFAPEWLRDKQPGEDRYWYFSRGPVNAQLLATPRHEGGWTYASLSTKLADIQDVMGDSTVRAALLQILNEAKLTLPEPALAALGIRRDAGGHEEFQPLRALEMDGVSLRLQAGPLPSWTVSRAGAAVATLGLNSDDRWTVSLAGDPSDLPAFMTELGSVMERISEYPTLEEAAPVPAPR